MRGQHTIAACIHFISNRIMTYEQLEHNLAQTGRTEEDIRYIVQVVKEAIARRKNGNAAD